MAEQCSDGVEAHAAIDGLGLKRMAKLASGDVSNSRV